MSLAFLARDFLVKKIIKRWAELYRLGAALTLTLLPGEAVSNSE